ncbi:MAG: hypothetical protein OS112_01495 [Methanoregula sp.]|nr:MAG: hypothetical protein OS112_01495 [Methanoregula sp.]
MKRGKSQVIFRYLPECVIDHSDTQAIAKISSWDAVKSESINESRLASEVLSRMERFRKRRGYPQKPHSGSFVFLEPSSIEAELFPLTFVCEGCGKAYSFDKIERFRYQFEKRSYRCTCGGNLRQLDMISYHGCGKISGLQVRACATHGYDFITLETNNSSRTSNWRWRCKICGAESGKVMGWCSDCDQRMETAPFRKSQVFYPHSISLINTAGFANPRDYENLDLLKLFIANYLGIISGDEFNNFQRTSKTDSRNADSDRVRQDLIQKGVPKDLIDTIIGTLDGTDQQTRRGDAIHQVDSIITGDGEKLRTLVSSLQSFRDTIKLPGAKDIDNVLHEARSRNDPNLDRILRFPDRLKQAGISEAYVVSDLPVVSAVFGYSRSTTNPQECTLRGFNPDKKYADKTPVYVNPTETEGIVLIFDRWRILRWLQENKIVSDIPDKDDERGLKQWFLTRIHQEDIPIYDEIPDMLAETKNVYTLIHTMSHVLVRKAAGLVGMDKDSLAEIIFPNVPAIAIYTNNSHDFQIGGMHTLFETGIIPWIDMAMESVETCLYDPVCISSDASCHACLHLSEISCMHFNRDLGRHYLIGRKDSRGRMHGYWENEFLRRLQ